MSKSGHPQAKEVRIVFKKEVYDGLQY